MRFDGFTITFGVVIAFVLGWLIAVKRKTGAWGF
jgi:hypothetical protein